MVFVLALAASSVSAESAADKYKCKCKLFFSLIFHKFFVWNSVSCCHRVRDRIALRSLLRCGCVTLLSLSGCKSNSNARLNGKTETNSYFATKCADCDQFNPLTADSIAFSKQYFAFRLAQ